MHHPDLYMLYIDTLNSPHIWNGVLCYRDPYKYSWWPFPYIFYQTAWPLLSTTYPVHILNYIEICFLPCNNNQAAVIADTNWKRANCTRSTLKALRFGCLLRETEKCIPVYLCSSGWMEAVGTMPVRLPRRHDKQKHKMLCRGWRLDPSCGSGY